MPPDILNAYPATSHIFIRLQGQNVHCYIAKSIHQPSDHEHGEELYDLDVDTGLTNWDDERAESKTIGWPNNVLGQPGEGVSGRAASYRRFSGDRIAKQCSWAAWFTVLARAT